MPVRQVPNPRKTDIERNMDRLRKSRVYVGIPASAGTEPGGKATLSLVAYVQEHGDDESHIPARPFLLPGMQVAGPKLTPFLREAVTAALVGRSDEAEKALHKVGLTCQAEVKRRVNDGPFAPLAESTLYARQHRTSPRANASDKPLIDTGAMFNAIT